MPGSTSIISGNFAGAAQSLYGLLKGSGIIKVKRRKSPQQVMFEQLGAIYSQLVELRQEMRDFRKEVRDNQKKILKQLSEFQAEVNDNFKITISGIERTIVLGVNTRTTLLGLRSASTLLLNLQDLGAMKPSSYEFVDYKTFQESLKLKLKRELFDEALRAYIQLLTLKSLSDVDIIFLQDLKTAGDDLTYAQERKKAFGSLVNIFYRSLGSQEKIKKQRSIVALSMPQISLSGSQTKIVEYMISPPQGTKTILNKITFDEQNAVIRNELNGELLGWIAEMYLALYPYYAASNDAGDGLLSAEEFLQLDHTPELLKIYMNNMQRVLQLIDLAIAQNSLLAGEGVFRYMDRYISHLPLPFDPRVEPDQKAYQNRSNNHQKRKDEIIKIMSAMRYLGENYLKYKFSQALKGEPNISEYNQILGAGNKTHGNSNLSKVASGKLQQLTGTEFVFETHQINVDGSVQWFASFKTSDNSSSSLLSLPISQEIKENTFVYPPQMNKLMNLRTQIVNLMRDYELLTSFENKNLTQSKAQLLEKLRSWIQVEFILRADREKQINAREKEINVRDTRS